MEGGSGRRAPQWENKNENKGKYTRKRGTSGARWGGLRDSGHKSHTCGGEGHKAAGNDQSRVLPSLGGVSRSRAPQARPQEAPRTPLVRTCGT